jgi:hypothetical protein
MFRNAIEQAIVKDLIDLPVGIREGVRGGKSALIRPAPPDKGAGPRQGVHVTEM